jgi:hypothetical protein
MLYIDICSIITVNKRKDRVALLLNGTKKKKKKNKN